MIEQEFWIAAYIEGCAYFLTAGPSLAKSAFGGPSPVAIAGIPGTIIEHDKLHYIGRVSGHDISPLAKQLSDVPLLYGLSFDGCTLRYEIESPSNVSVLDLLPPRPLKNWPYENYPASLPFVPLRLGGKQRLPYQEFASQFPNLEEDQPADLVVAVPAAETEGFSMWGEYRCVTIVFEYDFDSGTVRAYNVCD